MFAFLCRRNKRLSVQKYSDELFEAYLREPNKKKKDEILDLWYCIV